MHIKSGLQHRNKEVLVVVPSNPLRKEVNSLIRQHYIKGPSTSHEILVSKRLRQSELLLPGSYSLGDVLVFIKDFKECKIKKEDQWEVIGSDSDNIIVQSQNKTLEFSIIDLSKSVEVCKKELIPLATGERIKWTRNSPSNSFIVNGNEAIIKEIKNGQVKIELADGQTKKLKFNDRDFKYIDHNYSTTIYSAQGKTVDYIVGVVRSKEEFLDLTNQRSFYVTISRAKKEVTLITDHYKKSSQIFK
ncbi:MAG: hypothetical protein MRQ09_04860 [Candidatus Midichloria sp.]|nr:hypothetical protein [Candidatus Midichloria sp.]